MPIWNYQVHLPLPLWFTAFDSWKRLIEALTRGGVTFWLRQHSQRGNRNLLPQPTFSMICSVIKIASLLQQKQHVYVVKLFFFWAKMQHWFSTCYLCLNDWLMWRRFIWCDFLQKKIYFSTLSLLIFFSIFVVSLLIILCSECSRHMHCVFYNWDSLPHCAHFWQRRGK